MRIVVDDAGGVGSFACYLHVESSQTTKAGDFHLAASIVPKTQNVKLILPEIDRLVVGAPWIGDFYDGDTHSEFFARKCKKTQDVDYFFVCCDLPASYGSLLFLVLKSRARKCTFWC